MREGNLGFAKQYHEKTRRRDGLVPFIPTGGKIVCGECGNHCQLEEREIGYCNIRQVKNGEIQESYPGSAIVSWYYDPLPTNCVADWVCPVASEFGKGYGKGLLKNLAVFYGSCNSDCLFCQNASYRSMMRRGKPLMTPQELASAADDQTVCVCYFGGDPACSSEHSIVTSRILNENRNVRVCYETNGNISEKWLSKMAASVEETRGTFKFDLKAVSPQLYQVLTGISNSVVLKNFQRLAISKRDREGEFLVASILLIPGYIDINEIRKLSDFIAEVDATIPTALLGFAPHHEMQDLPRTSRAHAQTALMIAKDAGLENVRLGNIHLLGNNMYNFE